MYIYPENLRAKATLWLWELRDIGIIGAALLVAVFAMAHGGGAPLLVAACLYAFLTIRIEDASILDFLRYAVNFLLLRQQYFVWRMDND